MTMEEHCNEIGKDFMDLSSGLILNILDANGKSTGEQIISHPGGRKEPFMASVSAVIDREPYAYPEKIAAPNETEQK